MTAIDRPLRRSLLSVSPLFPQMLDMARSAPADIMFLDLEDSVPDDRKVQARGIIADFLAGGRPRASEVLVRVNMLGTPWGHDDLQFAATLPIDGVLLPKVEGDGMLRQAQGIVGAMPVWCLIETALGILRAEQIAGAGAAAFVVGGSDLSESLAVRNVAGRGPLLHALSQVVLVARAYGLSAIDALHFDYRDMAAIEASTLQSAQWGFDGKMAFDAATVALANRIFAPDAEAIAQAERMLGNEGGYGAHLDHARSVLRMAQRVKERDTAPAA